MLSINVSLKLIVAVLIAIVQASVTTCLYSGPAAAMAGGDAYFFWVLGTRGAVLHHNAETVLCFRNQVVLLSCLVVLSCCLVALSKYQSLERKPAYGVERAPCAFHNHSCFTHTSFASASIMASKI